MATLTQINEFLAQSPIAFAGVSRDKKKFTYTMYKDVLKKGYQILPVNPNTDLIDDVKCFPTIASLPEGINSLLIAVPKAESASLVKQAIERNIKNIFIQQQADTPEAIKLAEEAGINIITGYCILMVTEPVQGFHGIHKFFTKLFGKYPKD